MAYTFCIGAFHPNHSRKKFVDGDNRHVRVTSSGISDSVCQAPYSTCPIKERSKPGISWPLTQAGVQKLLSRASQHRHRRGRGNTMINGRLTTNCDGDNTDPRSTRYRHRRMVSQHLSVPVLHVAHHDDATFRRVLGNNEQEQHRKPRAVPAFTSGVVDLVDSANSVDSDDWTSGTPQVFS